ncbi:hypothetical protein EVJ32_04595 [Exiguobacterium sp. SH5S4]|uniref:hypothetical protein n=1 Tax=Exiguobacterium sp. SH5S4 TaxID=2510961 RepID=UPI00103CD682|nr:hypothetical protein [Exiguobacterium sp. SH5S4]TCI26656.1 hypothetical protein EVJ32_04595 [Exiguobacterium sp. SH5S4]
MIDLWEDFKLHNQYEFDENTRFQLEDLRDGYDGLLRLVDRAEFNEEEMLMKLDAKNHAIEQRKLEHDFVYLAALVHFDEPEMFFLLTSGLHPKIALECAIARCKWMKNHPETFDLFGAFANRFDYEMNAKGLME